jgi:Protein of unknown function (DUF3168)
VVEVALRKLLAANAPVESLVADRIFFVSKPQNERRASVVIQRITTRKLRRLIGDYIWERATLQLDCLAGTYPDAKALATAVSECLDQYEGTQDGTTFGYVLVDDERDILAAPLQGQALPLFGQSLDVSCLFRG